MKALATAQQTDVLLKELPAFQSQQLPIQISQTQTQPNVHHYNACGIQPHLSALLMLPISNYSNVSSTPLLQLAQLTSVNGIQPQSSAHSKQPLSQ
jgi:hypothetical protein